MRRCKLSPWSGRQGRVSGQIVEIKEELIPPAEVTSGEKNLFFPLHLSGQVPADEKSRGYVGKDDENINPVQSQGMS
jgi:hypothetical protein